MFGEEDARMDLSKYKHESHLYYDEVIDQNGAPRTHYTRMMDMLAQMAPYHVMQKQLAIEKQMQEEGVTYTLYSGQEGHMLERTIPFDMIPNIIPKNEWENLQSGLIQRVKALNMFIKDVYHNQEIIRAGIVDRQMVVGNTYFCREMTNITVPDDMYIAIAGIDLIRNEHGEYFVLEDNLRSPSGFSYLFKGRSLMSNLFPEWYFHNQVQDVQPSIDHFLATLAQLAPNGKSNPTIGLLTPGSYNAAYYEHMFLAQQMGIQLVEGRDMVVANNKVYIRDMNGLQQVDVLYRRIDDDFLDPLAFRPDSMLGVAGLLNAYRAGNIALANAPGTGVADDKAIYAYVPDMIRYYLNEEPILKNVPTYILSKADEREYVLERLAEMVVKETSLSGGYGMLIGPKSTDVEIALFAQKIREHPERYIAQPTIRLSRCPIIKNANLEARHIDIRAFVLSSSQQVHVIPGGLTRVAMKEGSLVVNSSQGGGVKDTWVL
jgi:uncharacterized circularly permuted ATP-grasp superfamily protein